MELTEYYEKLKSSSNQLTMIYEDIISTINNIDDLSILEEIFLIIFHYDKINSKKMKFSPIIKDIGFKLDKKDITEELFIILQNYIIDKKY